MVGMGCVLGKKSLRRATVGCGVGQGGGKHMGKRLNVGGH